MTFQCLVFFYFRQKLQEADVIFDPSAISKVLSDWLLYLNQSVSVLHLAKLTAFFKSPCNECGKSKREAMGKKQTDEPKADIVDESVITDTDQENDYNDKSELFDRAMDINKENFDEMVTEQDLDLCLCKLEPPNFEEAFYLTDPFSMGKQFHQRVKSLATMCFEFRLHGQLSRFLQPETKSCDVAKPITESILEVEKNQVESIEPNRDEDYSQVTCDEAVDRKDTIVEREDNSNPIASNNPKEETEICQIYVKKSELENLCSFVRCHLHCLDINRVFESVRQERDFVKRVKLWRMCMDVVKGRLLLTL